MKYLTKSDYLKYKIHPAYLWYSKNQPAKLPPTDDNQDYVYQQGQEFEQIAMELIEEPIVISDSKNNYTKLAEQTQKAIDQSDNSIAQGVFMSDDGLFCRPDLIEPIGNGKWRLTEIKSSTSFKQRHQYDLAFQRHVLMSMGIDVSKVQILYVNRDYVRDGAVDSERLVKSRDVTEEVVSLEQEIRNDIKIAKDVITKDEIDDHPALANDLNAWLKIYRHIHTVPDDSVFNLIQLKPHLVRQFRAEEVKSLDDIELENLTQKQTAQVKAWKQDQVLVEQENIKDFLNSLSFPLYFLDYETAAHVIPLFNGTKPYQQVPFQYSLHRLDSPGAELVHTDYLHTNSSLPVKPLADKLISEIGEQGTVIAWFHKFEMYCNRIMAQLAPEYKPELLQINKRMVDLRVPFARQDYVDKRFQGSSSLKNVLPVMCPELSYKELAIQEGAAAQRLWQQVQSNEAEDPEAVYEDLLEYCKLDTLAMVEIYRKLREVAELENDKVQAELFG